MGKKEGLSNEIKRRVHDTWLADKVDQQLLGMKPFADSMFLVGPTQFGLNVCFPLVELSIHQVRLVRARKRPGLSRELCGGANGEAGVFIPAMPPEPAKVWKTNEQAENYVLKKTKVWDTNEQAEIHLTMLHGRQC